jgi:hypothetical protein
MKLSYVKDTSISNDCKEVRTGCTISVKYKEQTKNPALALYEIKLDKYLSTLAYMKFPKKC